MQVHLSKRTSKNDKLITQIKLEEGKGSMESIPLSYMKKMIRTAFMSERVTCINKMCANKIEKEKQLKNRKVIDPYQGIIDPVEIIKTYHTQRVYDPLIDYLPYPKAIESIYQSLNKEEIERLITFVIEEDKTGNRNYLESIPLELLAFREANLSTIQHYMIEKGVYREAFVFKSASSEIIDLLFRKLQIETEKQNDIFEALAWALNRSKSFDHAISKEFSHYAGWEVNETKRFLYYDTCYPLVKSNQVKVSSDVLQSCRTSTEVCKRCHNPMTHLLEIDLKSELFSFLELEGEKLIIQTCELCSCEENLYMEFDTRGNVRWSHYNEVEEIDEEVAYLPRECLTLLPQKRTPFFCIELVFTNDLFSNRRRTDMDSIQRLSRLS